MVGCQGGVLEAGVQKKAEPYSASSLWGPVGQAALTPGSFWSDCQAIACVKVMTAVATGLESLTVVLGDVEC